MLLFLEDKFYLRHTSEINNLNHGSTIILSDRLPRITSFLFSHCNIEWQDELTTALTSLAELFADEHTVAAYEIQSSGIVSTLLSGLMSEETARVTKKLFTERANTFRKAFSQYPQR